jgi:hypothetical protein
MSESFHSSLTVLMDADSVGVAVGIPFRGRKQRYHAATLHSNATSGTAMTVVCSNRRNTTSQDYREGLMPHRQELQEF